MADPVYVRESDLHPFIPGQIDPCDSSHKLSLLFATVLQTPPFLPSALSLLMARVLADYANDPFSLDNFTFGANRLYRRTHLHFNSIFFRSRPPSRARLRPLPRRVVARRLEEFLFAETIRNPPARQIVQRKLNGHLIPRQDFDVMHPHLSGDMRKNPMAVFKLNPEHGVRQRFNDCPLRLN